jgi:hypothetical protein
VELVLGSMGICLRVGLPFWLIHKMVTLLFYQYLQFMEGLVGAGHFVENLKAMILYNLHENYFFSLSWWY